MKAEEDNGRDCWSTPTIETTTGEGPVETGQTHTSVYLQPTQARQPPATGLYSARGPSQADGLPAGW